MGGVGVEVEVNLLDPGPHFLTKQVRLVLAAQPDASLIDVSMMDNESPCADETEREVNKREGATSGALMLAKGAYASS